MTLIEFIGELQRLQNEDAGNGNLPVCLADWAEGYELPTEWCVKAYQTKGKYKNEHGDAQVNTFICIGIEVGR